MAMTRNPGNRPLPGSDGRRPDAGFTLVELLVVLAIIGLVAGIVAPQVLRYLGSAKVSTTQTQMANIASALDLYYLDVGAYPSQDTGLSALVTTPPGAAGWNGPYLKTDAALVDGWGKTFAYSQSEEHSVRVTSFGRDGKPQGEGLDADLVQKVQ
jgi:general secretion pathway protein G